MTIIDAYWTPYFNRLLIECDWCGRVLDHPTKVALVRCPCGRAEEWHEWRDKPGMKMALAPLENK